MTDRQFINSTDLRDYRIELPNLYDDINLDVYEFRLLAHYVRRGNCFESVRTTAKHCNISPPMVIKTRESLVEKGLITTQLSEHGTILITVVDKWAENFNRYSPDGVQPRERGVHTIEQGVQPHERGVHTVEKKNKPFKKEPHKKQSLSKDNGATAEWGKNLVKHPAMQVYRSKARMYVPIVIREEVAETVTASEECVEKWGEIVYAWIGKGWNPGNIKGMLDVYKNGWKGNGKPKYEPKPEEYATGEYSEFIQS